jgi:diguanylate cyclase (GGDEF)-like protein
VNGLALRRAALMAVLVLLYLMGVAVAMQSIAAPHQVTLLWPSAGVVLAAVARFGPPWAVIAPLSLLLAHATFVPVPAPFVPFSAGADFAGAFLAGCLVHRRPAWARMPLSYGLQLIAAALVMSGVSALIGSIGLWHAGMVEAGMMPEAGVRWLLGSFLGAAAVAPTLLLLERRLSGADSEPAASAAMPEGSSTEKHLWNVALAASFVLMAWGTSLAGNYAIGLTCLPLTVMMWSALRLSPLRTAVSTTLSVLLVGSMAGLGQAGLSPPERMLDAVILLLYLCVFATLPMALALAVDERRGAVRDMLRRSATDPLTGLPNRNGFEVGARALLQDPARPPVALAYVDLDNLKVINDTASHKAGDAVIASAAETLRAWQQPGDLLGHYGGDDFVVLLYDCSEAAARERVLTLLRAIGDSHAMFAGQRLGTSASIGLVAAPGPAPTELGELLSQADAACFGAKELGGNRVQVAGRLGVAVPDPALAMRWTIRIREALHRAGFELYAQTIEPLHADEPGRHFELLLRMRDPQGVLHSPDHFIPAAERFRLAIRIDREVVRLALAWFEANPGCAGSVALCSINLSAGALLDEDFIGHVSQRLRRSGFPPERLCFEITESSAMRDPARAQRVINELRALGCRFALDDFGTGFCSFGYLRALDVDFFKIDGSFVRDMELSPLSAEVVRSITRIAHLLGKRTIAEHTETEAIRTALVAMGVDYAQGYAIDRPRPLEAYFGARAAP